MNMQNNLYFLPSHDGRRKKKTFFLFEYTPDGIPKSSQINSTAEAVSIIQSAKSETTKNFVLDTSTNAGRNLLVEVQPGLNTKDRFFLAALYRTHYGIIEEYWDEWDSFSPEERAKRDLFFMKFFHTPRTLGGMRPLTRLDEKTLLFWNTKDYTIAEEPATKLLLSHPLAQIMQAVVLSSGRYHPGEDSKQTAKLKSIIVKITNCFCKLLQDPFPIEDTTNVFLVSPGRLFAKWPPVVRGWEIPAKMVSYVCRDIGESKKSDQIKRQQPILWELLDQSREFFCTLSGTSEIDQCFSWLFRGSHDFEHCMLKFLDFLLCNWTQILIDGHGADTTLSFVDHDIFVKQKSSIILDCCKKTVTTFREQQGNGKR